MRRFLAAALAVMLLPAGADAQGQPRAGDIHEIRVERAFSETATDGSETSSNEQDLIVERVIAVRETGVELEFDLPADAPAENRAAAWQFPMRVLRPHAGPLQLLNGPELDSRLARWLETATWPRSMCGRLVFTWNAYRLECEPQSAVRGLTLIDLPATALRDGAPYGDQLAAAPAALRREDLPGGGAAFTATLAIDSGAMRRAQAEANALTEALDGDDGAFREQWRALQASYEPRRYAGTVRIRFETDAAGNVLRRMRVTELRTDRADSVREIRTVTETIERRRIAPAR